MSTGTRTYRFRPEPNGPRSLAGRSLADRAIKLQLPPAGEPVVTVFMPTMNAAQFLAEAIESVLSQTLREIELLIMDGGSTDATLDIARGYARLDPRVKVLVYPNTHPSRRGNLAAEMARGRYFAIAHADDICRIDRMAVQAEVLEENPDLGICGSWFQVFTSYQLTRPDFYSNFSVEYPTEPDEIRFTSLFWPYMHHAATMVRMSIFREHGIRFREDLRTAGDYAFLLDVLRVSEAANVPEYLISYRHHHIQHGRVEFKNNRDEVRTVVAEELDRLGLLTPDYDLDSHMVIRNWNVHTDDTDRFDLTRFEETMTKVLQYVLASDRYAHDIACQTILAYWTRACAARSEVETATTLGRFAHSPLSQVSLTHTSLTPTPKTTAAKYVRLYRLLRHAMGAKKVARRAKEQLDTWNRYDNDASDGTFMEDQRRVTLIAPTPDVRAAASLPLDEHSQAVMEESLDGQPAPPELIGSQGR